MFYQNCRELPIHNFNEIIISGDLSYLLINRNSIIDKNNVDLNNSLKKKWEEIINEYETINNNNKIAFIYRLKAELLYWQNKIVIYTIYKDLIDSNTKNIQELIKPIKIEEVKPLLASSRNNLNKVMKQLEIEMSEDNKSSNQDFEKAISIVKGNGYVIDRYTLPVSEWIEILNNLEKKAKSLNNNLKN